MTVTSAASWRLAQAARLLGLGIVGLGASLALGADPKGALIGFAIGAGAFGGLAFLYSLSASDLLRLEPPEFDSLPVEAKAVATSRLLLPTWRDGALLLSAGAFLFLAMGPVMLAFGSGFGPGLFLAGLPISATLRWYERRNRCQLFVEVEGRKPGRRIFQREGAGVTSA